MQTLTINLNIKANEIQIVPLGDLHVGDEFFNLTKLEKTIKYISQTPNCYTIFNGDLLNNALKTSASDSYREKLTIEQQQDLLIKLLYPIKDKILYMTQGNHEYRSSVLAGIDPLRYVAKALGLLEKGRYSDNSYILNLQFGKNKTPKTPNQFIIYGIHGSGSGGRRMGSTVNALEDLTKICPNADLYLHSHTHVPIHYTDICLMYNRQRRYVEEFSRTFVNTCSFVNYGGYAERFGYKLTDQTPSIIFVKFKQKDGAMRPILNILKLDI